MNFKIDKSHLLIVCALILCTVSLANLVDRRTQVIVKMVGSIEKVDTGTRVVLSANDNSKKLTSLSNKLSLNQKWKWVKKPTGSKAKIVKDQRGRPTFTTDVDGVYEVVPFVTINGQDIPLQSGDTVKIKSSTKNRKPIAIAKQNQRVKVLSTVLINGTDSYDPDGDYLIYEWFFLKAPEGSNVKIKSSASAIATFSPDVEGEYVVGLIVSDGECKSSKAEVIIVASIDEQGKNQPPIANAGDDKFAKISEISYLDGRGSFDPDGDRLKYKWFIIKKPEGSNIIISNAGDVAPYFEPDVTGEYIFGLVVSDEEDKSNPTKVTVKVVKGNLPPVAIAGDDQNIQLGEIVILDGSKSYDKDGDKLTYQWKMISFPFEGFIVLDNAFSENPQFEPTKKGVYVFDLVVSDNIKNSNSSRVVIYVKEIVEKKPIADAGENFVVTLGSVAQLSGASSKGYTGVEDDLDAEKLKKTSLSYKWSIINSPNGSKTKIQGASLVNPTFKPDVSGSYQIQLLVESEGVVSDPDSVLVIVTDGLVDSSLKGFSDDDNSSGKDTINLAPEANAGKNIRAYLSSTIVLDGSESGDPEGDKLNYRWSFAQVPSGSKVKLNNINGPTPSFNPDKKGIYQVNLEVRDKMGVSKDSVSIKVSPVQFDLNFPKGYEFNQVTIKERSTSKIFSYGPMPLTRTFKTSEGVMKYGETYMIAVYSNCSTRGASCGQPIFYKDHKFENTETDDKF